MIQKDDMAIQEALEILKPFKACMFDQYGCPISDAAIALDVVIKALDEPKRTEERTETHACDLISRQVVINTVRTIILGFFSNEDGAMTDTEKTLLSVNKSICDGVRELPSAQPEIIHCHECRWRKDQSGSTAWLPCRAIVTPSDFYCSRAERRTDEGD